MPHAHARAGNVAERPAQPLRDHDGAMPSAGASDGDGEIALAFGDVIRRDVADVFLEPVHELPGRRVLFHEPRDGPIAPGARAEGRDEMRIRETSDIEHEI